MFTDHPLLIRQGEIYESVQSWLSLLWIICLHLTISAMAPTPAQMLSMSTIANTGLGSLTYYRTGLGPQRRIVQPAHRWQLCYLLLRLCNAWHKGHQVARAVGMGNLLQALQYLIQTSNAIISSRLSSLQSGIEDPVGTLFAYSCSH